MVHHRAIVTDKQFAVRT